MIQHQINVSVNSKHNTVDVAVDDKSNLITASMSDKQMLYVNDNKIGITGGNEIVPPVPSMDTDLLALYLLEKGGN